jgi:predicted nucleic-acid-binding Zn-ribbon protein
MIMPNMPMPVKCPKCGSTDVNSKWTFNTILAWVSRLMDVKTVKIWDKKCRSCGEQFKIFRK